MKVRDQDGGRKRERQNGRKEPRGENATVVGERASWLQGAASWLVTGHWPKWGGARAARAEVIAAAAPGRT